MDSPHPSHPERHRPPPGRFLRSFLFSVPLLIALCVYLPDEAVGGDEEVGFADAVIRSLRSPDPPSNIIPPKAAPPLASEKRHHPSCLFAMTPLPANPSRTSHGGPRLLRASRLCPRSQIADDPACWHPQVQPSYLRTENAPLIRSPHLSGFHPVRAFATEFGLPPHVYQIQVRLTRARALLATGLPPATVAAEVGFADQSHLTRHFRFAYGISPGHYLANAKSCREAERIVLRQAQQESSRPVAPLSPIGPTQMVHLCRPGEQSAA